MKKSALIPAIADMKTENKKNMEEGEYIEREEREYEKS
jgi:hypothetical protein